MKYHWMIRYEDNSPNSLKKVFKELNDYNYSSCMLTYHSKKNDMFIKLARAVDPDLNLNYIVAIRTYAISPEYLSMMINGFNEIAEKKLMLNIVSGDIHKDETSIEDMVDSSYLYTSQQRVEYTGKWLEKFVNLDNLSNTMPDLFMSGTSEKTFSYCERFNGGTMTMVDYYLENIDFFSKFKRKCVSLQICIRDTDEEAAALRDMLYEGDQRKWCYYYSEETLYKKIKELEDLGVTDLMITGAPFDPEMNRVHDFVKRMSKS